MKEKQTFATPDERDWGSIAVKQRPNPVSVLDLDENKEERKEVQLVVRLSGVGVSLISRSPSEELLYMSFNGIVGELLLTANSKRFCISVWDIQVDNQVRKVQCENIESLNM